MSHMNVNVTIPVDHIATASICSLRLRGILEGTKLHEGCQAKSKYDSPARILTRVWHGDSRRLA